MYSSFTVFPGKNFEILWTEKTIEGITFLVKMITFLANDTMHRSLQSGDLSIQKAMSIHLTMTIQLLKLYLKLAIYRCKNYESTSKNGDFNRKNDKKAYSKAVYLSL